MLANVRNDRMRAIPTASENTVATIRNRSTITVGPAKP